MEETAFAKLNLALHVRARGDDGYHDIETLFAFVEHGDRLSANASESLSLSIDGPFAPMLEDGDNLVLRAATALRVRYEIADGAKLSLTKSLPVAAGIGGGSADAAAVLRLLNRWWGIDASPDDLRAIAASLGADVPACIASRSARGEGRGDRLWLARSGYEGAPVLLVNPGVAVSTAKVFAAWDGVDRGSLIKPSRGRNDLEPAARSIAPAIADVLEALGGGRGVRLARMSGSGATCFAIFEDQSARDELAASIAARRPDWWLLASRIRQPA